MKDALDLAREALERVSDDRTLPGDAPGFSKEGMDAEGASLASLRGRLCELDGGAGRGAALTFAAAYLREAQGLGEAVAWIQLVSRDLASKGGSTFFAPDLVAWGIDLAALPVVRARGLREVFSAADKLLRSGAFGLLVIDFEGAGELPLPVQSRLLGLLRKHAAVLLFLCERGSEAASLGSLFSLRLRCRFRRDEDHPGRFLCRAEALKDKRAGPGWFREIGVDAAPGLR